MPFSLTNESVSQTNETDIVELVSQNAKLQKELETARKNLV
jgi:hypothetical protein